MAVERIKALYEKWEGAIQTLLLALVMFLAGAVWRNTIVTESLVVRVARNEAEIQALRTGGITSEQAQQSERYMQAQMEDMGRRLTRMEDMLNEILLRSR